MATVPNEHFVNFVDENGVIMGDIKAQFKSCFSSSIESKSPYFIISIMGGQSGGKSTLLNFLFDTKFAVLPSGERCATTKGILMASTGSTSADKNGGNILVLDLEGADSNEKREADSETFARKSTLFALALSEILIVNVWAHDVGKRSAMNLSILQSVFEANMAIKDDCNKVKTTIVFAIRDFDPRIQCSITKMEESIMSNLRRMWNLLDVQIDKMPQNLEELFDFVFVGIPHKEYCNKEFMEKVSDLKKRFSASHGQSLIKQESHLKKTQNIPMDSLVDYMAILWGKVDKMQELNITSHKLSVVSNICGDSYKTQLEECQKRFEERLKSNEPEAYGEFARTLIENSLKSHTKHIGLEENSAEKKRSMDGEAQDIFDVRSKSVGRLSAELHRMAREGQQALCRTIAEKLAGDYLSEFRAAFKSDVDYFENLKRLEEEFQTDFDQRFKDQTDELQVQTGQPRAFSDFKATLQEKINSCVFATKNHAMLRFKSHCEKEISKSNDTKLNLAVEKGGVDVWKNIHLCRILTSKQFSDRLEDFSSKAGIESARINIIEAKLKTFELRDSGRFLATLKDVAKQQTKSFFKVSFEKEYKPDYVFNFDKAKHLTEVMQNVSKNARNHLMGFFREEKFDWEKEIVFTADVCAALFADFEEFVKNKEEKELKKLRERQRNKQNLPFWVYIALILLGYNEFVLILKNPLLLAIAIIAAYLYFQSSGSEINLVTSAFKAVSKMTETAKTESANNEKAVDKYE